MPRALLVTSATSAVCGGLTRPSGHRTRTPDQTEKYVISSLLLLRLGEIGLPIAEYLVKQVGSELIRLEFASHSISYQPWVPYFRATPPHQSPIHAVELQVIVFSISLAPASKAPNSVPFCRQRFSSSHCPLLSRLPVSNRDILGGKWRGSGPRLSLKSELFAVRSSQSRTTATSPLIRESLLRIMPKI